MRGMRIVLLGSAAVICSLPGMAQAQQAGMEGGSTEAAVSPPAKSAEGSEIVVTARLKNESLQDMPSSVFVQSGEALQADGIVSIESLATTVPNFAYSNNIGASDNIFIRGLGTVGAGPQFEPAVGQQFNGVPSTRSRLGRSAFFDIAQVEVLRGPQGAVSSKNTSLGLVNIVPNKPTDYFEGHAFGSYTFTDIRQGYELEGAVSGPVTQGVRARLAVSRKDLDGHIYNIAQDYREGGLESTALRGIVDFDLGPSVNVELLGQYLDQSGNGKARELIACANDGFNPATGLYATGTTDGCTLNRVTSSLSFFDGEIRPEAMDLEAKLFTGTISVDLADNLVLTAVTGYQDYTITDQWDIDNSTSDNRTNSNLETYETISQEIRLAGSLGDLDFILGGFYSDEDLFFDEFADFGGTVAVAPGNGGPGGGPLRRELFAEQNTKTLSFFVDGTYPLTSNLELTGGVRYFDIERSATFGQTNYTQYTLDNRGARCGGVGFRLCTDSGLRKNSDQDLTWNVGLKYRPTPDMMFFATAATGYKAGGFSLTAGLPQAVIDAGGADFAAETSTNYELGGRHDFDLGAADLRFNWTLFRTEIDNAQISSLDAVFVTQIVKNAATVRSTGVEFDGYVRFDGGLKLSYSGAYTDAEFTDYQGASCYTGQTEAEGCVGGVQDRTGTRPVQAPEWSVVASAEYVFDLGNGLEVTPRVGLNYRSEFYTNTELDPLGLQDSVVLWNASIKLAEAGGRWELSLVGRNLTDKTVLSFVNDTTTPAPGATFALSEPGRTIALNGRINF